MNPWVAFILGLLIGWLVEWVIDWWYGRRKNAALQAEAEASCRRRVADLEQEVASYRNQLASLQAEHARLEFPVRTKTIQSRGIELPIEADVDVPAVAIPVEVDVEPPAVDLPVDVDVELPAVDVPFDVDVEYPVLDIPVVEKVEPLDVEIAAAVEPPKAPDLLEEIKGLTSAISKRLNDAGIFTFAALAKLRPPQLRNLVADLLDRPGSEVEMIKQARLKAGMIQQVDDLVVIVGIGPVISRLLNNAGIFTFAELGALSAAELREIVGERIQRLANEEDILAQARELAEKQNQGG